MRLDEYVTRCVRDMMFMRLDEYVTRCVCGKMSMCQDDYVARCNETKNLYDNMCM